MLISATIERSRQLQIFAKALFLHQRVSADWTVPGVDAEVDRKATRTRRRPLPHYEDEGLFCHCCFGREYLLPYKHVFYLDMHGPNKVLTPGRWMAYASMFDELGLVVYEIMGSVLVEDSANDGGKVQSLLELREINKQFQSQLYLVHKLMENMRLEDV